MYHQTANTGYLLPWRLNGSHNTLILSHIDANIIIYLAITPFFWYNRYYNISFIPKYWRFNAMFKTNPNEGQMSIMNPYLNYPKLVKDMLQKSWAPYFKGHIFHKIEEERFAVLYSNKASRPNTPVNILVGLLFLKELCGWTDHEMISSLFFDYRVQYALGITELDKERICINTITNFRSRLCRYEEQTGVDLLQQEVDALTQAMVNIAAMDTSLSRQDSMMLSANCKKMNRLELIYTVNANMVKQLNQYNEASIPPSCQHYLDKSDKNEQLYRLKKEQVENKIAELLNESLDLLTAVPAELQNEGHFANLFRMLEEQTILKDGKVDPKPKEDIAASSLQNPSEPDATYRKKKNQDHIGYVLNLVEARDDAKEMSMIIYHEEQQNIVSDVELGQNALKTELNGVEVIASDGGYYSPQTIKEANERRVELVFSALTGRKAADEILGVNEFLLNSDRLICLCPGLKEPVTASYDQAKEIYRAKFEKADCAACPLINSCPVKEQVRYYDLSFTEKKLQVDICRSRMGTAEYREMADFRAGVEGVPSILRRRYHIDNIPVRGLLRRGAWIHSKIMACNFHSFFTYLKQKGAELAAVAQGYCESLPNSG
jgi:hypothetical protein